MKRFRVWLSEKLFYWSVKVHPNKPLAWARWIERDFMLYGTAVARIDPSQLEKSRP